MSASHIHATRTDGIMTITFDRPDALNAFTRTMANDFIAMIDEADRDDCVRVVLVTGAGRAFCAGADLSGGGLDSVAPSPDDYVERDFGGLVTLRMFRSIKPIIFAINGSAAGMGVTMALAADMRMASTDARFVLPFVRRGIVPESCSAWFLPRIVGIANALELVLRGGAIPADEALRMGLVRSLHAPEDLMPAALTIAREIADNCAPVSVALSRQLLWQMLGSPHPMEAHQLESRMLDDRKQATDLREGVASFLEKRVPRFTDRPSADMPAFFPWAREPPFQS